MTALRSASLYGATAVRVAQRGWREAGGDPGVATERPVFVVDLYTRRLLQAESIYPDALTVGHEALRLRIESALSLFYPEPAARTCVFNELHALIVAKPVAIRRTAQGAVIAL